MMFKTETAGYSESISTVIDGMVVLNWNKKIVGELKHRINDNSMLVDHRNAPIISRVKAWFRNQQRINDNIVRRDIGDDAEGSLVVTMRGLQ